MINISKNTSRNKLTRKQLEIINRRTIKDPLQIAEKDYFLALAIQLIYNSSLENMLIFKGGTALHHCYLPQKRFSEDLDFTSIDPNISIEQIISSLESTGTFQVNKSYESEFMIKIERLQYQGLLGQPGNIRIEVDHHQNVVLPGIPSKYQNVWKINASPLVMDQREICAEKIRAVSQRARYRDFYDLYFLINEVNVNFNEALNILKHKEIRAPIAATNITNNWSIAKEQKASELGSIYCSEVISNKDIEHLIQNIQFDDLRNSN